MMKGKVVLVTGAGRGIGRGFAERLAAEGASVAVHGRRELGPAEFGEGSSLTAVAKEIGQLHSVPTLRVQADLTSQDEVQRVVDEVTRGLGPIDVLIHNAGGDIAANGGKANPNDAVFISEADWRAILENNLTSTILMCQAVAKSMIERGTNGGRIITLSSDAGVVVNAHGSQAIYATAKAGVNHFSKALGQQLRHYNINVNVISPGSIASGRIVTHTQSGLYGDEAQRRLAANGTLDRFGTVEECANVALFLAGPLGTYVSGEVIKVNGGSAML